jgi:Protein of unknown function (DUF2590)
MADYFDLLISADAIALDQFGLPQSVEGRASIAQDLKIMIRESGLLVELIAERNAQKIKRNMIRIEQMVENDIRITPGTAVMTRTQIDEFYLTAKTIKYGDVEIEVTL